MARPSKIIIYGSPGARAEFPPEGTVKLDIPKQKRGRGRVKRGSSTALFYSKGDELARFLRDPNRIAAAIAAERIKELKVANPRRYRVTDEAIDYAIAEVIEMFEMFPEMFPGLRKPVKDTVTSLVRKGTINWPDEWHFEF